MDGILSNCPVINSKTITARKIMDLAIEKIKNASINKINLIWLEATGCAGNIISLLNAESPDVIYLLDQMVTLKYNNSLMAAEGEAAFQQFLDTLDTEFILVVEGAVATKDDGRYTVIARYKGELVTAMEAVKMAGEKAKHVVTVGTCASYGGPSAARPNPSQSVSVPQVLNQEVIRVPGCPSHPDWAIGTIANLIAFGVPALDAQSRPIIFYGITIHDRCTRRSYFDNGIFATKLGDPECMFKLGCRGPVTRTDCPVRQWNGYVNWPIEDNAPCIGCAQERFPDGMEPFVRY
ncbi:Periplasmic [NiFeSe] hydrogenase small subunit precursor [Clostridium formicaceticum]|uniref:Periplasmic [NiFeSe] hydrogenase small subunit n=2 Tax=Clostridium formicaceticum TaxID=1497 RepID=A0AAC9RHI8_9CLOT|nr:Periplasmic [NiFeSe] hydrogenase small subunit precursor [Clostridium formicaceticum]